MFSLARVLKSYWTCISLERRLWYVHVLHLEFINEVFSCPKLLHFPYLIFSHICSSCIVIYNYICLHDLT
jgi:hypothetical protein